MLPQLDVVVSELLPEDIQNFNSSTGIEFQNFINLFKTKWCPCLVSLLSTGCQQSSEEIQDVIEL